MMQDDVTGRASDVGCGDGGVGPVSLLAKGHVSSIDTTSLQDRLGKSHCSGSCVLFSPTCFSSCFFTDVDFTRTILISFLFDIILFFLDLYVIQSRI